jgi:hypothetical protein
MKNHQMILRSNEASVKSGFYRKEKIVQPFVNPVQRVRNARKSKVPRILSEFVTQLGSEIVRNLKSTGISGRCGLVKISKIALLYLKNNFDLKKKNWTSAQNILQEYSIENTIFRDANPKGAITCSNLELKLGYATKNEYFGKNEIGKIILKSFNERQNVHFRFDRNIQSNGNLDSSTENLVRQRNAANGIGR